MGRKSNKIKCQCGQSGIKVYYEDDNSGIQKYHCKDCDIDFYWKKDEFIVIS